MIGYPYMPDGGPPEHPVIFITDHGPDTGMRCNYIGGEFNYGGSFPIALVDGVWMQMQRTNYRQHRAPFTMRPVGPYLDRIWRGRTPDPATVDEVAQGLPIRVWDPGRGPVYPDA